MSTDEFMREVEKAGGGIVVCGGLWLLRRASEIAMADGRNFSEVTLEVQTQYVELAKAER